VQGFACPERIFHLGFRSLAIPSEDKKIFKVHPKLRLSEIWRSVNKPGLST
jgi:hypothetical protein